MEGSVRRVSFRDKGEDDSTRIVSVSLVEGSRRECQGGRV